MFWSHRVPTYFDRLLDTIDLRACYRHHKLELQLLQVSLRRRRRLGKVDPYMSKACPKLVIRGCGQL